MEPLEKPLTGDATPDLFICYRRKDSRYAADHIYRRLAQEFGAEHVFKDVDAIPLGRDFREILSQRVGASTVFLAIIGNRWLTLEDASGGRALNDPSDFVRVEIESALRLNIPVIPVLVEDGSIPSADELPSSLAPLAYRQGTSIRPDPDFDRDIDRLIRGIKSIAAERVDAAALRRRHRAPQDVRAPKTGKQSPRRAKSVAAQAPLAPEAPLRSHPEVSDDATHAPATRLEDGDSQLEPGRPITEPARPGPLPIRMQPPAAPRRNRAKVGAAMVAFAAVIVSYVYFGRQPQDNAQLTAPSSTTASPMTQPNDSTPAPNTATPTQPQATASPREGRSPFAINSNPVPPPADGVQPAPRQEPGSAPGERRPQVDAENLPADTTSWNGKWFMQFSEGSKEAACLRASEPDLRGAVVLRCDAEVFSAVPFFVRLGPAENRTELDQLRKKYLDRGVFSVILRSEDCSRPLRRVECSGTAP